MPWMFDVISILYTFSPSLCLILTIGAAQHIRFLPEINSMSSLPLGALLLDFLSNY
jgi:hypothetical protein